MTKQKLEQGIKLRRLLDKSHRIKEDLEQTKDMDQKNKYNHALQIAELLCISQRYIQMREREGELLNIIMQITDSQTASAVKDILNQERKEFYQSDRYLRKLDAVVQALLSGVPAEKILSTINNKNWFADIGKLVIEQRQTIRNETLWTHEQCEIIAKQIRRIIQLLKECKERNRRELYRQEWSSRTKDQTWKQAKHTQKYKRYELRIYGNLQF